MSGSYEPMDLAYGRRLMGEVMDPILDHYFRARLLGADRIPVRGPVIVAANHSGTAFPYDGIALDAMLWRHGGLAAEAKFRSMFEKELALTWWMNPFGIDNFWRRAGGVDATFDNFDRLLARGERVIYYPEGVPGIGKGFQNRYKLQPFRSSFVVLAAKHRAPVVPVSIINAEWIIPFNVTIKPLDRLFNSWFHVPFLPLPGALIAIAWPWVWYLTLPARLIFKVGEPIDIGAWLREAGVTDPDRADREAICGVAERLRRHMQTELDRHVARIGRAPYRARSLAREIRRARGRLSRVLPPGWPAAWIRHERNLRRPPARNRIHALLRDWDIAGFFVPLGWPLLSLTRALRRPPCGYRGVSPEEARERRGAFIWSLRERPLPPKLRITPSKPSAASVPEGSGLATVEAGEPDADERVEAAIGSSPRAASAGRRSLA